MRMLTLLLAVMTMVTTATTGLSQPLASRSLTATEAKVITSALPSGNTHCVIVIIPSVADESEQQERSIYGSLLIGLLKSKGWDVQTGIRNNSRSFDMNRLTLWTPEPHDDADLLVKAFEQAHVTLRNETVKKDYYLPLYVEISVSPDAESIGRFGKRYVTCPRLYIGKNVK